MHRPGNDRLVVGVQNETFDNRQTVGIAAIPGLTNGDADYPLHIASAVVTRDASFALSRA